MNETFTISSMRNSSDEVVGILKSLANTDRLLILCYIAKQELNVAQIEQLTQIGQPTLSQQLMILRRNNMVTTRRDGKQIFYRLKDANLFTLLDTLHELYCKK
ncbi:MULTISPECIES: metalloregulator ArsR/SmtB family transcription factor [unclassified Acinetobacter]|uniref:metalloregulator ArsR/SmtB family transcription factor n=1 Tax=unclassified Acinetobacter TaxID=196816 RepID=UPI0029349981|nr:MULTISPECIES: metalloregulator ArsR/SmtB family transcription factor [unclassified Acinetobacter]WOE32306.1 metalloregulator ArsR/SmtB family transcription factor [Acinetobacter sp. SAAs470]WOE37777.1 metalloregulator ArsR/SmtB family transcription factor [Acinetobacter sp. SAAs474]